MTKYFKTITPRTRLKFSIIVTIANFIMGIIGMILGTDLTALGVFLTMANTPLFAYILGQSLNPTKIPDEYFKQPHGGSGGLGNIVNNQTQTTTTSSSSYDNQTSSGKVDEYTIPIDVTTEKQKPIKTKVKKEDEIG